MAITDWHENDRPREKLLKFGEASLSDAELLAIFLRTGIKGKSAVALAQDLLNQFGSLYSLLNASEDEFCQGKGLGQAKYTNLRAVLDNDAAAVVLAHNHPSGDPTPSQSDINITQKIKGLTYINTNIL